MRAFLRGPSVCFAVALFCLPTAFVYGEGLEFSPPAPLNSVGDPREESFTAIKTDGKGHWVAAWSSGDEGASDIVVSRSVNNGETWTAPVPLNTNPATDFPLEGWVNLATDCAGNWLAVWIFQKEGEDLDLISARSTDNGENWSDPVPVTQNVGDEYLHSIATDKNGVWIVVCETLDTIGDEIGPDQELLVIRSTDNGATWSPPKWLNTNAPTDNRDDYEPCISVDVRGLWVVTWNSVLDDSERIHIARSTNGGVTWSSPSPLNSNPVDHINGASLLTATDSKGHWVAAWNVINLSGPEVRILSARSTDGGQSWSAATPINPNSASDSNFDFLISLVTDEYGNWVATWMSEEQLDDGFPGEVDIEASFSTDNGATWSEPIPIDTADDPSDEDDYYPRLAADGVGNWVCTWDSINWDSEGPYGTVFVSRAFLPIHVATIKVLAPNGGEKWKQGSKHNLTWESSAKGGNVRVELRRNGGNPLVIQASTPDDGEVSWKVPKDLATGKGYKVSVTAVGDAELTDQSDSGFRIKPK